MPSNYNYKSSSSNAVRRSSRRKSQKSSRQPPSLPLEIWFQILTQTLNLLLPLSTTPRTYSTYILPLLLTSHTFHEHCHPVTYPHLRKHRLLQLFTRWKAAHSREVHFYHHPLNVGVRYALPDRVGNPPGEEYETLYSFIKRAYLFGCESVCGTVIPVEGGLEGVAAVTAAAAAQAQGQAQNAAGNGAAAPAAPGTANATAATTSAPASAATGLTTPGNVVVAPPVAPTAAPVAIQQGGDGGGQGWKGHALQWHVANPTFAAEGTIDLYRDVVEEYRRVVCGSAASRERSRQLEQTLDRIKNPHRYPASSASASLLSSPATTTCSPMSESSSSSSAFSQEDSMNLSRRTLDTSEDTALEGDTEDMDEDDSDEEEEEEEEEEEDSDRDEEDDIENLVQDPGEEMIEQDQDLLLNEIEAKGGLRRRDSGHGQSSSEMDIDEDADDELDHEDMVLDSDMEPKRTLSRASNSSIDNNGESDQLEQQQPRQQGRPKRTAGKREPDTMAMDYELEGSTPTSRQRRGGLRSQTQQHQQKSERLRSASEQERIIMDMSLDKPFPTMNCNPLSPFFIERPSSAGSCSSSSTTRTRSGSPGPLTPLGPISFMVKAKLLRAKSSQRLALHRSLSSPASSNPTTKSVTSPLSSSSSSSGSTGSEQQQEQTNNASPSTCATTLENNNSVATVSPSSSTSLASPSGPLKAEDLGFDLASACANTFASDLAFVLARVPGLGAHFHRFEQLAKLKLHVGWAKHAQSRGGNDVFVMSCSRLIAILAPLANTPLVSERGGGLAP